MLLVGGQHGGEDKGDKREERREKRRQWGKMEEEGEDAGNPLFLSSLPRCPALWSQSNNGHIAGECINVIDT